MKTLHRLAAIATLAAACLGSLPAFALGDDGRQQLQQIQSQWAEIRYRLPENQREAAYAKLAERADAALKTEPRAAELLIWRGIVLSSWAGAKGGLGALGLVKDAKASLEAALAIDPRALDGSAYTSLGSLYYQVPGWPVAFGDDKQAEAMLKKALEINPSGIDPNYFYADYLVGQKRYAEARSALQRADAAAPRPGREVADEGRHGEIRALMAKLQSKE